jgi:hypothetical protein
VTYQMLGSRLSRDSGRSEPIALPDGAARLVAALLALGIATAHVADQGGLTAFTAPDWLGWAYRLIELGGVRSRAVPRLPRLADGGCSR